MIPVEPVVNEKLAHVRGELVCKEVDVLPRNVRSERLDPILIGETETEGFVDDLCHRRHTQLLQPLAQLTPGGGNAAAVPPLRKILAERCLIVAVYGDRHGFCVVDFQNLFDVAGLDVDVKRHERRVFVHQCNLHDNTSFSGA